MMDTDQLGSVLRAFVPFLTSALIGWGVESVEAGLIAGALVAVLAAIWGWFNNRPKAKLTSAFKSIVLKDEVSSGTVIVDGVPIHWSRE